MPMVFGNLNNESGTGVAFTRDPATGENKLMGEFLINAQGEDVVAGVRTPMPIAQMEQELAGKGRVLIRPSGTEALIRVMVEAKTTEVARKVAEDLADLIKILSEKIQF